MIDVFCGGHQHRISCNGSVVELLDHPDADEERVLEALGGSSSRECFVLARAWTDGMSNALPSPLDALCRERWRSAGVPSAALAEFETSLDDGPRGVQMRVGGLHPRIDAALWWEVLGRRPTPELIRSVLATGVDLTEAVAWCDAIGGAVTGPAIAALRRREVMDGYDARTWVEASGRIPDDAELDAWTDVGVRAAHEALAWSQLNGGPVTPDVVRGYRRSGITDPEEHLSTLLQSP